MKRTLAGHEQVRMCFTRQFAKKKKNARLVALVPDFLVLAAGPSPGIEPLTSLK